MRIQLVLIACFVIVVSRSSSLGQTGPAGEKTDSLEHAYADAISKLRPPKLIERKNLVRGVQQRGYASTLLDVLDLDGMNAILSFMKNRFQIELSLPHEPIMVDISAAGAPPYVVGLNIDWTFPTDPWSGE